MFKYVLFLTYLFLGLGVANCLETGPFSLSEFAKSHFSVDIDGKKRVLLFDEGLKKYGLEHKGSFKWAEFGRPLKITTSDHKKIQIEFYNQNYVSIQIWNLAKLGVFEFSLLSVRGEEVESFGFTNDKGTDDLLPRSIFSESGLTHIPTVKVFYLPTKRHYFKSTDEREAEKNLAPYLSDLSTDIKNEYIVHKNFCLAKKEHGSLEGDCVGEALTTLLARHIFKDSKQLSSYESCMEKNEKRLNCVVQTLVKDQAKEIPEFLFSKADVESKLALVEFNCTQKIDICLKKVKEQLFTELGLNNSANIVKKVASHRKFTNDESLYFESCYRTNFNVSDCLIKTESQTFLRYLRNDLTQRPELLSIFEEQIKKQVNEGKHPTFQNVLVSGMEKILPEINWHHEAVDIFKRGPDAREAILKFKLIASNHFSSFTYEKSQRHPASSCGIRRGELERDFAELLESCR